MSLVLIDAERVDQPLDELIDDDDDVGLRRSPWPNKRRRPARQAFVDEIVASIPILPDDTGVALRHADLLVAVRRAGNREGPRPHRRRDRGVVWPHDRQRRPTRRGRGRVLLGNPATPPQ